MIKIHNDTLMMLVTIGCLFGFGLTNMLIELQAMNCLGVSSSFLVIVLGVVLCFKIDKLDQHFKDFEQMENYD